MEGWRTDPAYKQWVRGLALMVDALGVLEKAFGWTISLPYVLSLEKAWHRHAYGPFDPSDVFFDFPFHTGHRRREFTIDCRDWARERGLLQYHGQGIHSLTLSAFVLLDACFQMGFIRDPNQLADEGPRTPSEG